MPFKNAILYEECPVVLWSVVLRYNNMFMFICNRVIKQILCIILLFSDFVMYAVALFIVDILVLCEAMDFCSNPGENCLSSMQEELWNESVNDTSTCCNLTSKPVLWEEPQKWQTVYMRDIMVFSAFIERRSSADGLSVRIIGSGLQEQFHIIGQLYCQLWYMDKKSPYFVEAKYIGIYPNTFHRDAWSSHFILCPLSGVMKETGVKSLPYAVSVAVEPCIMAGNVLMVLHWNPVQKLNTYALCLPPLYGNFQNWTALVETFELHKLLGVAEIIIYSQSMSKMSKEVLQAYNGKGVTVVDWNFPKIKTSVYCQRAALNACLYHAGHVHKYITITDLDEVLVPRAAVTWPELMKKIASPLFGAYLFQHIYFRRNNTGEKPYLITQQSTWRNDKPHPPGKIRCKSMYDSDKAISLDLHFPYEMIKGVQEYILDPDEGLLHHYRILPLTTFRKNPERFTFIEDLYMHRYKKRLTKAYKDRLESLKMMD